MIYDYSNPDGAEPLSDNGVKQDSHKQSTKTRERKYEYKVNLNLLIGLLKNKLVIIILTVDPHKRLMLLNNILTKMNRNLVPIRPNRENPTRKKRLTGIKYPVNKRKSL